MKLAMIVPGGVDRSGEYRVIPALLALIKHLAREHELHVFALYQEQQPGSWDLAGARIHNVGRRLTRLRAIAAVVAEHRRAPFAVIQSIFSGTCGQVAVAAAMLLRLPAAVHVAGGELVALPDIGYGGRLRWRNRVVESLVLRRARVVTAASQPMIASLAALGIRGELLPLGADHELWPARDPLPRDPLTRARLIHVASLNRVKDQPTLLLALATLMAAGVDFQVDMVGEDTLAGAVQSLARDLGLGQRLEFHGFLTQRQLRPLLEAAHLLVMSSRHEAGPIVVVEAALAGVPTVGTAVGHIDEWAPEAATAVPVGDAPALAKAIRQLLDNDSLRLCVANAARRRASSHDAGSVLAALYRSIVA